jgi:hypothetical protein
MHAWVHHTPDQTHLLPLGACFSLGFAWPPWPWVAAVKLSCGMCADFCAVLQALHRGILPFELSLAVARAS